MAHGTHAKTLPANLGALEAWANRLDVLGVTHSGVQDVQGERGGPLIVLVTPLYAVSFGVPKSVLG